ncbi:MAG TPA: tetratricopeptide repeat protein [Longimicrobiaceae bacterium]|nr:tetratricopeptide repeat protein [Longimicrobiaceae bacterium]
MSEPLELEALRARRDELRSELERMQGGGAGEREALRDGIVGLFHDAERLIAEATELRESIRPLVDGYKRLFPSPSAPPAPARVDHLGSSTFVERAWNAIAGCRYDVAVREAERALELAPGDPAAETLLAWARMRTDRHDEARALLESVLERDAGQALARACLGYVALRQGCFAEAIEHLSRVLRGEPERKAALYANLYLGMVYSEREMYRDARTFFGQALELGPNLIEAHWELGSSYYREGEPALAAKAWRRGAEANRFNIWGERCQEAAERVARGEPVSLT